MGDSTSPTILTFPTMDPSRPGVSLSTGTSLTMGFPRFVTMTGSPVACTSFITARQRALKAPAGMKDVQATGEPVIVTKRGKPIVKLVPVESENDLFGFMAGKFKIVGDIESPVVPLKQWKITKK